MVTHDCSKRIPMETRLEAEDCLVVGEEIRTDERKTDDMKKEKDKDN